MKQYINRNATSPEQTGKDAAGCLAILLLAIVLSTALVMIVGT